MSPSRALESYGPCTNSTPDVAGLAWNLDRLLALSDDEIGSERRARWAKLRKEVPALPMMKVARRPAIIPAEGQPVTRVGEGENPELYAVFPFRIYGLGKPELEMARHTFARRGVKCGWGWCQDDTQAAFLGLAGVARHYVSRRPRSKHRGSRFPAFWGPHHDWVPDQPHGGKLQNLKVVPESRKKDVVTLDPQ